MAAQRKLTVGLFRSYYPTGGYTQVNQKEPGERELIKCPFCESTETEMIALFGMQMMTSQYYCRHCHSVFEAVKWGESKTREPGQN